MGLGSIGPFTFTGVCKNQGANKYLAYIEAKTSAGGSFFYTEESDYYQGDFDPGDTGLVNFEIASTAPYWFGYDGYYNEFAAASPDGSVLIEGHGNLGVHVFGADCAFNLGWTNNA